MFKKSFYITLSVISLCGPLNAMNDIDNFIRDRCGAACNGESDECVQCYNAAIDFNDQGNPDSPEVNFDIYNEYGKLKLVY